MSDFSAVTWTASELLTGIYRKAKLPDSGSVDYPPSVVLAMATAEIHEWGGHQLAGARDGRLVTHTIRDLSSESVNSDGNEFILPPMAVAQSIESVAWVDDGDRACERRLQLTPIGLEPVLRGAEAGTPTSYVLAADTLRVYPIPEGRGSLKISYMRRHGQLVIGSDTTSVIAVLSVSSDQLEVQLTSAPASFVTGSWMDIYSQYYPYRLKASLRNAGTGTDVFWGDYEDVAANVDPGDTAVILGKTPYVHLPLELKSQIEERVAMKITAELGDFQLSTGYDTISQQSAARTRDMLSPRAKSDKQKLINPYSLARGGVRRRLWNGGGA